MTNFVDADGRADLPQLLQIAKDVVLAAGQMALAPPAHLQVDTKSGRNDLVTEVDKAIEDQVAKQLTERTGLPLMGEESHQVDSFAGLVWVLDPIDGTTNYVETGRDYAVSLALCQDGKPVVAVVLDVVRGQLYHASLGAGAFCNDQPLVSQPAAKPLEESIVLTDLKEIMALPRLARALEASRGHRRYGSAALECVEVAAGRAGAFVHLWVSPWDIAAATLICQETGVQVTRLDGTPMDVRFKGSILVGTTEVHRQLLHRMSQAGYGIN